MQLTRDGISGLVVLAGSLLLLAASRDIPQPPLVPIGPAFYPRLLLAVTALLGLALVLHDLTGRRGRATMAPPARLVLLTFAIFAAYVVALPRLGFRLSTFLFVLALAATLEPPRGRRWALVLATALATTAASYYVFERYLSVLLPRGSLTGF